MIPNTAPPARPPTIPAGTAEPTRLDRLPWALLDIVIGASFATGTSGPLLLLELRRLRIDCNQNGAKGVIGSK